MQTLIRILTVAAILFILSTLLPNAEFAEPAPFPASQSCVGRDEPGSIVLPSPCIR